MNGNRQAQEIATIKERFIALKLSDADCERLLNLTASHNISIADLLESFIGDLVDGTYTNGSDERDRAQSYFERCYFGLYPERTFINYLIENFYIDDYVTDFNDLESWREDLREAQDPDDVIEAKENIEELENSIEGFYNDYITDFTPDFDSKAPQPKAEALEGVRQYINNYKKLMEGDINE